MTTLATVIAEGVYSAIPAFGIQGRLYFATDTHAIWYDTGTSWINVTPPSGLSNPMTTEGDIIVGAAAGATARLAAGTSGEVLTSNGSGSEPSWQAPTGGMSNPMTTEGDIIIGAAAGAPTRLAAGTSGDVLTSNGSGAEPSWQSPSGGSGAIDINGSVVSSPNLNSTSPSADAGFQAIPLKVSGSNVISQAPLSSSSTAGLAKVDNTSIIASGGVISAKGVIYGVDSGSANNYLVAIPSSVSFSPGSLLLFFATHTNTGSSTVTVTGGGAITIKKEGSITLVAGDIAAGQLIGLMYDGSSAQLLGNGSVAFPADPGVNTIEASGQHTYSGNGASLQWNLSSGQGEACIVNNSVTASALRIYNTSAGNSPGSPILTLSGMGNSSHETIFSLLDQTGGGGVMGLEVPNGVPAATRACRITATLDGGYNDGVMGWYTINSGANVVCNMAQSTILGFGTGGSYNLGAPDTGISRDSAGVFDFGNGAAKDKSATLQAGVMNLQATQSTESGSTSGSMICSQPFQGASYKKVVIRLSALNGTASYTFPTAFSHTPDYFIGGAATAATVSAISTTSVTITGAPSSGVIILEGF